MSEFRVGCSPLTNKIYAGKVLKGGIWAKNKYDVTDDAVSSVAQHLLRAKEKLQFSVGNKTYELTVVEVKEKGKK